MKTAIHGQSSIVNRRNVLDDPSRPPFNSTLTYPARIQKTMFRTLFAAPALSSSGGLTAVEAVDEISQESPTASAPCRMRFQNLLTWCGSGDGCQRGGGGHRRRRRANC